MQQTLRKIGLWIWEKKERMVFAIMIIFLGWRVYQVVYPPPPEEIVNVATPSASGQMEVAQPPTGGGVAPPKEVPRTGPITGRNPFWYYAQASGGEDTGEGPSVEIVLLGFQDLPNGVYARMKVGVDRARSLREGEQFQTFVLTRVAMDDGYVEVLDQSNNESYIIYEETQ